MGTSTERRAFFLSRKCERVVSHVFSTASDGSEKRPGNTKKNIQSQMVGIKDTAIDVQTTNESQRGLGGTQEKNVVEMKAKWRTMKLPTMAEKNAEKVWKAMALANF